MSEQTKPSDIQGEGWRGGYPPYGFFKFLKRRFTLKRLKLSIAVYSSSAEIYACQFCVIIFNVAMATANFLKVWPKIFSFLTQFSFFFHFHNGG